MWMVNALWTSYQNRDARIAVIQGSESSNGYVPLFVNDQDYFFFFPRTSSSLRNEDSVFQGVEGLWWRSKQST